MEKNLLSLLEIKFYLFLTIKNIKKNDDISKDELQKAFYIR
jgi:hypothetical protein